MSGKRKLTRDDRAVWSHVTRGIEPYHAPAIAPAPSHETGLADERPVMARARPMQRHQAPTSPKPPATIAGDPKLDRRAARGRIAIEATLDLHGYNQGAAHAALRQFLIRANANHHRCVLVITGKGAASSGSGILRRRFLEWINERELRDAISRVAQAHQRHGGAGAFYIFLKTSRPARINR